MPTGCPLGKKDHEFGDCMYLGSSDHVILFNGIYKCKDCGYEMIEGKEHKDYTAFKLDENHSIGVDKGGFTFCDDSDYPGDWAYFEWELLDKTIEILLKYQKIRNEEK